MDYLHNHVEMTTFIIYNIYIMVKLTINGVNYQLPADKLYSLITWLQQNGATELLEGSNPNSQGKTLINE